MLASFRPLALLRRAQDILFMNSESCKLTCAILDLYLKLFLVAKGINEDIFKIEMKGLSDTVIVMILQRFKIANEAQYNLWMAAELEEKSDFFGLRRDIAKDLFQIMVIDDEDDEMEDMAE